MIPSLLLQAASRAPAWGSLLMPLIFIGIFYFIIFAPQQRQRRDHRALIESLTRGEQVATLGGVIGEIVAITDDTVTLKTGDSRVVVERSKIAHRMASPKA
jgi:preprotein translocase subunit YajC